MLIWIPSILLCLASLFFVLRERRSFYNAILVTLSLMALYATLLLVILRSGRESTHYLAYILLFIPPLILIAISIYLIINGIRVLRRERFTPAHMLSLCMGIGNTAVLAFLFFGLSRPLTDQRFLLCLVTFFVLVYIYFIFGFVCTVLYAQIYQLLPQNRKLDYILILGCGLRDGITVTPLLRKRLEKAYRVYRKRGQGACMIPCGGQGPDEKIPEALAMKRYLMRRGVPEAAILMEDRSTSTEENLRNAKALMDRETRGAAYNCVFVSSNYHIYRAGLIARQIGLKAEGIGAHTAFYYWPTAMIREYIAIIFRHKQVFLVWVGLSALVAIATSFFA